MRPNGVVPESEFGQQARERFAGIDLDAIEFLLQRAEEPLDPASSTGSPER